jgi:hypothetical protein
MLVSSIECLSGPRSFSHQRMPCGVLALAARDAAAVEGG